MEPYELLINALKRLGFHNQVDEPFLLKKIELGMPVISVRHKLEFEDERVDFLVSFKRQIKNGIYKLDLVKAVYCYFSGHYGQLVDGIHIEDLEALMRTVNWNIAPNTPEETMRVMDVCTKLGRLQESKDPYAAALLEMLFTKYWAGTIYGNFLFESRVSAPDRYRYQTFSVKDFQSPTAYYCFAHISGKRDQLLEILQKSGFDIPVQLDRMLHSEGFTFSLADHYMTAEGLLAYDISVVQSNSSDYLLTDYSVTFTRHPAINHGNFMGVDTAGLEERMAAIDWLDDSTHYIEDYPGDFCFNDEISDIIDLLQVVLRRDQTGQFISDQFQAKYWAGSPDLNDMMDESATAYFKTLPSQKITLPITVHARSSYNLFMGREVAIPQNDPTANEKQLWWAIDKSTLSNAECKLQQLPGMTAAEIMEQIKYLPVNNQQHENILTGLLMGDKVKVPIHSRRNIFVACAPLGLGLKLYDENDKRIFTNLMLDTGWQRKMPFRFALSEGVRNDKNTGNKL